MAKSVKSAKPKLWHVCKLNESFTIKRAFADYLFEWGRKLAQHKLMGPGLAGGFGSLSYRFGLGFVVTSQQARPDQLADPDLMFVETWDFERAQLNVHGVKELAEATLCHAIAYRSRGGVIFVFHAADPAITERAVAKGLPRVRQPFATDSAAFIQELEAQLGQGNLVAVPDCGIFSLGCTPEDAGEQLLAL